MQPRMYVGPIPIRRPSRDVTTEPISPPTAPAPRTIPSVAGRTFSERTAYRMKSAWKTKLKRLIVAVASSEERMTGEVTM